MRLYVYPRRPFACCTGSCEGAGTSGFAEKVLGPRPEGGRAPRAARSRKQAEGVAARGDESDRDEGEGQGRQEHPGTILISHFDSCGVKVVGRARQALQIGDSHGPHIDVAVLASTTARGAGDNISYTGTVVVLRRYCPEVQQLRLSEVLLRETCPSCA